MVAPGGSCKQSTGISTICKKLKRHKRSGIQLARSESALSVYTQSKQENSAPICMGVWWLVCERCEINYCSMQKHQMNIGLTCGVNCLPRALRVSASKAEIKGEE